MNRRHALMTLLAISLVVGPFLFIVPSVVAKKPVPPDPIVWFDDGTGPKEIVAIVEWDPYPLPDEYKQIGPTYKIIPDPSAVTEDGIMYLLLPVPKRYVRLLDDVDEAGNIPLAIVQYGVLGDVNDDGIVTGDDVSLIANANKGQYYVWSYDLERDNTIDELDIHVCNQAMGNTPEGWDEHLIPAESVYEDPDTGIWYLVLKDVEYFCGWGIR